LISLFSRAEDTRKKKSDRKQRDKVRRCISRAKCDKINFHLRTVASHKEIPADAACPVANINRYSRRCVARNRIGTALAYEVAASKYVLECTFAAGDTRACLYA